MSAGERPPDLLVAAHALAVDARAAPVLRAWREAGIDFVLLKGPALVRVLPPSPQPRPYGDIDLLVPPRDHPRAERLLGELGYRQLTREETFVSLHARPWQNDAAQSSIDLHTTLWGSRLRPADVWEVLLAHTEETVVAGEAARVPKRAAAATLIVLHAAQHGPLVQRPLDDLRAALRAMSREDWSAAEALADRLEALPGFAAGLATVPEAEAVAARLPLVAAQRARGGTPDEGRVVAAARWRAALGLRARARIGARLLVPDGAHMRAYSRLARRGRRGLVAAYLARAGAALAQALRLLAHR